MFVHSAMTHESDPNARGNSPSSYSDRSSPGPHGNEQELLRRN